MKRNLYYVVQKESRDVGDDIHELTGWKAIQVYDIIDNMPKPLFDIEVCNSQDNKHVILEYLDNNGYGYKSYELIEL